MKTTFYLCLCSLCLIFVTSACSTNIKVQSKPNKVKTIPPGQAKKITGSKSAKPYAPGQNK